MKRLFIKKFITSIVFIIIVFIFFIGNIKTAYKPIMQTIKAEKVNVTSIKSVNSTIKQSINDIEGAIEENTFNKYMLIEVYGYLQKLMYKNEESNFEVVKDKEGGLQYTYFIDKPNPVTDLAKRTADLKNGLKNKNSKFIYLMTSDKYIKGYSEFYYGIPYNYANETADNFLKLLKKYNVSTIDFRNNLSKSGIPLSQIFYKTDHHWTTQTAFWEAGQLVKMLNEKYNLNLDPGGYYTNKENYNFITYKASFLGSLGRKAGVAYSGIDDFTLIYPKFSTDFSFYSKTGNVEIKAQGRFEDALLSTGPFRGESDLYDLNAYKYFTYLCGNQGIEHIVNKNNPNGPKMVFIKDSLIVPVAAFLSTVCSEVYLVDPRYYDGNIPEYVNKANPDFVFVSFTPQDLTKDFFKFYEEK